MEKKIDFDSYVPYYIQLIEILKGKISSGVWRTGTKLPSEPELCEIYGISRTVVRQAFQELEYQNLISRKKGKGTFVIEPKINESLVQKLTGFYQDMVSRGHAITTKVLRNEIIPADQKIGNFLKIDPGVSVYAIERLRFVNDEPIVLVTTYLPCELCPGLERYDLSIRSLYDILETELGLELSHGRRSIEAVPANAREAALLHVKQNDPMILLDSVSFLKDGTPIEYYHAIHRGDRSRFEVELYRGLSGADALKTLPSG